MPSEEEAQDTEFRLGYVSFTDDGVHNLRTPVELNEAEFEAINDAVEAIARCSLPFQYKVMERNYQSMVNSFHFVVNSIAMGRRLTTRHPRDQVLPASVSIVNWLTSVRLFLDHAQTDLTRRFGRDSAELKRFKDATAAEFDSDNPGYRFVYMFRNYVQHCGLPIAAVQSRSNPDDGPGGERTITLTLSRSELIESFDDWRKAKPDLEGMDEEFSLLPLAKQAMDGLRRVYTALLVIELEQAVSKVGVLQDALQRLRNSGEESIGNPVAVAVNLRDDGEAMHFDHQNLPVEAITKLSSVADGQAGLDTLYEPRTFDDRPFAAGLDEHFPSGHRGVGVVSTWITEGGLSPGYLDEINRVLQSDNDFVPLVNGLVDVAVVLVHLVAQIQGTTPESVIATMISDQHPDNVENREI